MKASPFIVYVDETGDHGLASINPTAPIFALCAALYRKEAYLQIDLPALARLKFAFWGHDAVVLHSRSLRRRVGPFAELQDAARRQALQDALADFFAASACTLVCAAIDKPALRAAYAVPSDPYALTVTFVLERLFAEMQARQEAEAGLTHVVFESRGAAEDGKVRRWFETCCAGENRWRRPLPFEARFAPKSTNMAGLQVADLAAYPIARHVGAPDRPRPDWLAVEPRLRRSAEGRIDGWGLKVFPKS